MFATQRGQFRSDIIKVKVFLLYRLRHIEQLSCFVGTKVMSEGCLRSFIEKTKIDGNDWYFLPLIRSLEHTRARPF